MASFEELVKRKIKVFEDAPDELATAAQKAQAKAWRDILPLIQKMDVDSNGNIAQTEKNIERIGIIADELNKLLGGKEYQEAVKTFLSSIDKNVELTTEIAQKIDSNFEPTKAQKNLLALMKKNVIDSLFGYGLRDVSTQFVEALTLNLGSKSSLSDTIKALETVVVGTNDLDGKLVKHIKTVALTASGLTVGAYSRAANDIIGAEFFKYIGGEIPTTREFCQHREGEIWHRKEFEAWGNGKNSGGLTDIENGTWQGRADWTNVSTIFDLPGGWNCRHAVVPILTRLVPETVKNRAAAEGFYNPTTPSADDNAAAIAV